MALMVTLTAADVVDAPVLSRATAVSAWVPTGVLFHVTLYGLVVSDPISVAPAKTSTRDTLPSASDAVALTIRLIGAVNVAPFDGAVTDTTGGWLAAATVMATDAEVVLAPLLSRATAVNE